MGHVMPADSWSSGPRPEQDKWRGNGPTSQHVPPRAEDCTFPRCTILHTDPGGFTLPTKNELLHLDIRPNAQGESRGDSSVHKLGRGTAGAGGADVASAGLTTQATGGVDGEGQMERAESPVSIGSHQLLVDRVKG